MEKTKIVDKFKASGHIFGIMVTLDADNEIDKDGMCYLVMIDTVDGEPYKLNSCLGYYGYVFEEEISLLTEITMHAK